MANICGIKLMRTSLGKLATVAAMIGLCSWSLTAANAQNASNGVTVNLNVLDDLDPMKTLPRLLMPSSQPARGRIILTPPAGTNAITPQRSRITLRPPAGTPTRVDLAPKITVPKPAAAAAAPPVSVTSAPPAPVAAVIQEKEEAVEAPTDAAQIAPSSTSAAGAIGPVARPVAAPEPTTDTETTAEAEVASLPVNEESSGPISIRFGEDETELPPTAARDLTEIADLMKTEQGLRVQLLAYASSADGSASSVRRKSLSRALSVREFLMDQGIQSTRIEVRALGDQSEGGNPNRVDAIFDNR